MPVFHLIFAQSSRGLFLLLSPQLLSADDSLMFPDWRLGGGNHLIIPPDDFVTIIQVMGFAPEVRGGPTRLHLHILRSLTCYHRPDLHFSKMTLH